MRAAALALLGALVAACGGAAPSPTKPVPPMSAAPTPPATPAAPPVAATWDQLHGPIRSFSITGGEDIDYLRLQPLFNDEVGKPIDRLRLRGKLDRAMEAQTLADLQLSGEQLADGVRLVVHVTPQPNVVSYAIRDAAGQPMPLPAGIKSAVGGRLVPALLDSIVQTYRDEYAEEGNVGFGASWHAVKSGEGVAVTIDTNPGERIMIAARTFDGAKQIKSTELDRFLTDAVVGQPWIPDRVQRAELLLEGYYWDHGFAQVSIHTLPPPAHNPATLVFQIHEGDVFHLGRVEVSGVPPADVKRYLAMMKLKPGALFSRTQIANAREAVSDDLAKAGHPKAMVLPLTKVDVVKHTITLSFEIAPDGG